jgi:tRNA (guanine-N7-)-methyltransferase
MIEPPKRRRIRSFVLRSGRMTEAQQRAYDQNWDQWGLEHNDGVLDVNTAFGRDADTVLEIGFGMGQSLVTMAAQSPQTNFVGVEVHRAGVGKLLHGTQEQSLDNIRVYCHDAVEILRDCIAADSLAGVQIFFPDPWHKRRHNKRRLIQPGFIEFLVTRLRPGGTLHVATDWQHYAEQIMAVLSACDQLHNSCSTGEYAPRPELRPLTKFEARGERLGHGVWDLIFYRS